MRVFVRYRACVIVNTRVRERACVSVHAQTCVYKRACRSMRVCVRSCVRACVCACVRAGVRA